MEKYKITYTDIGKSYHKGLLNSALQGKNITEKTAEKLAKALKVEVNKICEIQVETEPYAYETIDKIKRTLRAILSLAKKQRLIDDNYARADSITFPKKPPKQIEFLSDIQAKKLFVSLQTCENIKYKTAIITLLLTGIRRGELCGLEWNDIDLDKGEMTIARNVTTVGGFGVIEKDPKTELSKRTLTMPTALINQLKEYKKCNMILN